MAERPADRGPVGVTTADRRGHDADDPVRALEQVGARGWLHAVDIDSGLQVGHRADEPVVLASVAKLLPVLALFREADRGRLDLSAPQTLDPERRSGGPTGLSVMKDTAVLSLRDLAYLALALSDSAAADALLGAVGLPAVAGTVEGLGLVRTRFVHPMHQMLQAVDSGPPAAGAWRARLDPEHRQRRHPHFDALPLERANSGSAADLTRLLVAVWRDEAASPASCAAVRRLLGLQVWGHRLASGFPSDDILVSGKTGTLLGLRHEVGVVEYPGGGRYAVAVLAQSASRGSHQPHVDAAVGRAAHLLVRRLRLGG